MFINHNGKIIKAGAAIISAENRSFRYGDGLFETIRYTNGRIMLEDLHFHRLFTGMKLLQFQPPSFYSPEYFIQQVNELVEKNQHSRSARVRLMVFRGNGGVFDPENDFPNFIIESSELNNDQFRLNENGLIIDVFPGARKACDQFSHLKSNNYLPYLMAAKYSKANQLNDCLVLNSHGRIADSCIANIFLVRKEKLITNPLIEGPVSGVMRAFILQQKFEGMSIEQHPIEEKDILSADECFLSNAIYGIRWVQRFRDKIYSNTSIQKIYNQLSETISN